jgi:signal transduction histidine kinase
MADPSVLAVLAAHRTLGTAPPEEHEWLVARGTVRNLAVGDILTRKGELASALYVVFSGYLVIRVDRGAGAHKIFERRGGDVTGVLPFSRGARPPNDVVAEEATELLAVPSEHLAEMIRECPAVTAMLVHEMIDRVRVFNSADLHDEKLVSLGKLAAGLAHELNNPTSAVVRSAALLTGSLGATETAATAVAAARMSDAQLASIADVRQRCIAPTDAPVRGAMARADDEDAISDWLADHGASEDLAAALSVAGLTPAALDTLAATLSGDALDASLRWIASGCLARTLASEIETAASRIYDLVNSVKGFTYMDHALAPEPVDIRRGLHDTLMMLGGKTRQRAAVVSVQLPADLPRAHAVGAELNQVWMNLIDNALDAVAIGGHVTVAASREMDRVVVRVVDDGKGIPPEIMGRIFDPFFTTKGVGEGTGLGLDIVRRILRRHEGEIDVDSRPGHTEFRVMLPMAQ